MNSLSEVTMFDSHISLISRDPLDSLERKFLNISLYVLQYRGIWHNILTIIVVWNADFGSAENWSHVFGSRDSITQSIAVIMQRQQSLFGPWSLVLGLFLSHLSFAQNPESCYYYGRSESSVFSRIAFGSSSSRKKVTYFRKVVINTSPLKSATPQDM